MKPMKPGPKPNPKSKRSNPQEWRAFTGFMRPTRKADLKRLLACGSITKDLCVNDMSEAIDIALADFLQRYLPSAEKGAAVNLLSARPAPRSR